MCVFPYSFLLSKYNFPNHCPAKKRRFSVPLEIFASFQTRPELNGVQNMPALKFWLKTNNERHNYELLIWKRIKNVRLARTGLLSANVTLVQSMPSFLYSSCSHKKMCCQTKNKTKFSERNIWFAAQLPQLIMKRSAFVKGYNLLAARMRILASLSVSRMEKKVFRLRSCFCRVSFPGERKLLLLQCFSTVISLFTWLKKNWSCSLAKLMQACSKLFFSKCSKPNISRIPTGCKKKKKKGYG